MGVGVGVGGGRACRCLGALLLLLAVSDAAVRTSRNYLAFPRMGRASYLAFPRMGRAPMAMPRMGKRTNYLAFPRMGRRSSPSDVEVEDCCPVGFKSLLTTEGLERVGDPSCSSEQCCPGLEELYAPTRTPGLIATACAPRKDSKEAVDTLPGLDAAV